MKKTIILLCAILLCSCLAVTVLADESGQPYGSGEPYASGQPYEFVDSHLHYLDFVQETDGFEKLTAKMDENHVSSAVLLGMAMAKEWDDDAPEAPTYYLSNDSRCYYYSATDYIMMNDYMAAPPAVRNRFYPFICGVNTTDRYAAKYLRRLLETYPGEIFGFGELMNHHDDLSALTYGDTPRPNNEAMKAIYDLAAEYDIPILLHSNIGPVYADDPLYLDEMKEALAYNPKTNIIWAHAGISRRIEISNLTEIADEMLSEYPNLYYDISWVVFDEHINDADTNPNADSLHAWAALIEKYPDRFVIGTDIVAHFDDYGDEITKYYTLLDILSPETARMISKDNILRIIHAERKKMIEEPAATVTPAPAQPTVTATPEPAQPIITQAPDQEQPVITQTPVPDDAENPDADGQDSSDDPSSGDEEDAGGKLAEIQDRGYLLVGSTGDYKPMSYLDPATGTYWGFDAELAEDLAWSLGVDIVYVPTTWPTLMDDTLAGNFDLAICGITITDARKEQALMSDGYFANGKTVLCRAEDAEIYTSLEAINRPEVRVMENPGGLNEKFALENLPNASLIIHDVNEEIPGLIAAGEADVMITEIMEAGYYVGQDPRLAAPLIYAPFTHGELGVLMNNGSEDLLDYVNTFLANEKASGRIDQLAAQYIYQFPDTYAQDAA